MPLSLANLTNTDVIMWLVPLAFQSPVVTMCTARFNITTVLRSAYTVY